jgi:uncharacterized protein
MDDLHAQLDALLLREAAPRYKYGHQPRLYALTQQIACRIDPPPTYDDEVVLAAAYLHDLGVFVGHRPEDPVTLAAWNHIAYACEQAPTILARFEFPAEKLPAVLACIREHLPQAEPTSFEATLLRDADMLEQLGAVGILRTAAKLDSDTRFHQLGDVRRSLQRALDTLPALLRLDAARELALPRIQLLRSFLLELDEEAGEHLD